MMPAWYSDIAPGEVLQTVAKCRRLTVDDLKGPSRRAYIVRARWEAMRLLRERGLSLPAIGLMLNRHHTAVLHGLRRAA